MAKMTIVFGVMLGILGGGYFVATGSVHPTALIPLWFGIALIVCGVLAMTEDVKRRMIVMHIAVTIGLLGFLFPGIRAVMALVRAHSEDVAVMHPDAIHEELAMAVLCLLFVLACVKSFIAARRTRVA
jgi:hypothetical protein